jgi:hypothetical protein
MAVSSNILQTRKFPHIYKKIQDEMIQYKMTRGSRTRLTEIYHNAPFKCDLTFDEATFQRVDMHFTSSGIKILNSIPKCSAEPSDIVTQPIISALSQSNVLYGDSDASLKDG